MMQIVEKIMFISFDSVLSVMSLLNLFVISLIMSTPSLQTITNGFIVSLCLADFLHVLTLAFTDIPMWLGTYPFGHWFCKGHITLETTARNAAMFFVAALSFDRYLATCQQKWCAKHRKKQLMLGISTIIWLTSLCSGLVIGVKGVVIAIPSRIQSNTTLIDVTNGTLLDDEDLSVLDVARHMCIPGWRSREESQQFVITMFVCFVVIPIVLIVLCYIRVMSRVKLAMAVRLRLGKSGMSCYQRTTRLVLTAITFHVLSWLPNYIQTVLKEVFKVSIMSYLPGWAMRSILRISYINAAFNPILYALMTENFRNVVWKAYCSCLHDKYSYYKTRYTDRKQSSNRSGPGVSIYTTQTARRKRTEIIEQTAIMNGENNLQRLRVSNHASTLAIPNKKSNTDSIFWSGAVPTEMPLKTPSPQISIDQPNGLIVVESVKRYSVQAYGSMIDRIEMPVIEPSVQSCYTPQELINEEIFL